MSALCPARRVAPAEKAATRRRSPNSMVEDKAVNIEPNNLECAGVSALCPARRVAPAEQNNDTDPRSIPWPHAPPHWLLEPGLYMVTAGTYQKARLFNTPARRDLLLSSLLSCAAEFGWSLRAWAVLENHYHFVAVSPAQATTLRRLAGKLHMTTAKAINAEDATPGRKVWFQFFESHITYERSYFARLNYVHHNPVHHKISDNAENYRWCSAAWFRHHATPAFVKTVQAFPTDELQVQDEY